MEAAPQLLKEAPRVTVVDDVITKGRTLYAGCVLIKEALPEADVRAFAVIRTMGLVPDIVKILDPVEGTLKAAWDDVVRVP
jgi:adenine/guanine phosphoribosyltransferase-like PRPP-binding protein